MPLEVRAESSKDMDNDATEEPSKAEQPIEEPVNNAAKASTADRNIRPKRKAAAQGELIRKLSEQV